MTPKQPPDVGSLNPLLSSPPPPAPPSSQLVSPSLLLAHGIPGCQNWEGVQKAFHPTHLLRTTLSLAVDSSLASGVMDSPLSPHRLPLPPGQVALNDLLHPLARLGPHLFPQTEVSKPRFQREHELPAGLPEAPNFFRVLLSGLTPQDHTFQLLLQGKGGPWPGQGRTTQPASWSPPAIPKLFSHSLRPSGSEGSQQTGSIDLAREKQNLIPACSSWLGQRLYVNKIVRPVMCRVGTESPGVRPGSAPEGPEPYGPEKDSLRPLSSTVSRGDQQPHLCSTKRCSEPFHSLPSFVPQVSMVRRSLQHPGEWLTQGCAACWSKVKA